MAGPLTQGDQFLNVRVAMDAADVVMSAGHVPFVPHLAVHWHALHPRPYEDWIAWCLSWVETCDALIRLEGESPGSDREVEHALANGLDVYEGLLAFLHDVVPEVDA